MLTLKQQLDASYFCACVLLFMGLWLIGYLSRWVKILDKNKVEPTLTPFSATAANLSLKILLFISVAGHGRHTNHFFSLIIIGVSIAVTWDFNGSLGNLTSGIMLLIFRFFKLGDNIKINNV
ncbi:hypothetical protein [Bacteroidetes bacterium endosymbiont of Geopemphigus sp.]|uniref:hypothetical protein n=1 Tax=Bacteroidetes bacterium endosymbiont of Geopemphigus sp. TaxID=2047937 RepID=UPI000CD2C8F1|nr:hypothetical protein [Bacteroidetes bacterium endosymbiont of Geopemphigus sp.]